MALGSRAPSAIVVHHHPSDRGVSLSTGGLQEESCARAASGKPSELNQIKNCVTRTMNERGRH